MQGEMTDAEGGGPLGLADHEGYPRGDLGARRDELAHDAAVLRVHDHHPGRLEAGGGDGDEALLLAPG